MNKIFTLLEKLPPFGASGDGLPETPPLLPENLKIYFRDESRNTSGDHMFCHGNYILCLLLAGKRELLVEELHIELNPGDAIIIPPFTKHAFPDTATPFKELKASFHLPPDELRLKNISGIPFRMKKKLQKNFFEAAGKFSMWFNGNSAAGEECVCGFAIFLRRILAELSSELPREIYRTADYRRLTAVVEYLAANRHRKVALKELSQVLHLSGSTIRQLFKRHMNTPIGHYELVQRLKHGAEMLRSSDLTAGEVAARSGFESASSFLRALRRETGMNSRQMRSQTQ